MAKPTPDPPPGENPDKVRKYHCRMRRRHFSDKAQPVTAILSGADVGEVMIEVPVPPKQFNTGSFGWYSTNRKTLVVDGEALPCMINVQIIVLDSKNAK